MENVTVENMFSVFIHSFIHSYKCRGLPVSALHSGLGPVLDTGNKMSGWMWSLLRIQ